MLTNINITQKKGPVPHHVKVHEVATLLGISRQTVHVLIQSGQLTAHHVNPASSTRRHLRITGDSLSRFYKKRFGQTLDIVLNPLEQK